MKILAIAICFERGSEFFDLAGAYAEGSSVEAETSDLDAWDDTEDPLPRNWIVQRYLLLLGYHLRKYKDAWATITRKIELHEDDFTSIQDCRIDWQPNDVVRDLHETFRGEMWVGRHLCYRDGEELQKPFTRYENGWCHVSWFPGWDNVPEGVEFEDG